MKNKLLPVFAILALIPLCGTGAQAAFSAVGGVSSLSCAQKAADQLTHKTGIRSGEVREISSGLPGIAPQGILNPLRSLADPGLLRSWIYDIRVSLSGQTRIYELAAFSDTRDPGICGKFHITSIR